MKFTAVRPTYNPLYQDGDDVRYEKVYKEMTESRYRLDKGLTVLI